jgi:hypothetical protein
MYVVVKNVSIKLSSFITFSFLFLFCETFSRARRIEKLLLMRIDVRIDPLSVGIARVESGDPQMFLQDSIRNSLSFEFFLDHRTPDSDEMPGKQFRRGSGKFRIEVMKILDERLHDGRRNAERMILSFDKDC